MRQLSNEAVWYIIRDNCIQSFSISLCLLKKLAHVTTRSKILISILIAIIVEGPWVWRHNHCMCSSLLTVHSEHKEKNCSLLKT